MLAESESEIHSAGLTRIASADRNEPRPAQHRCTPVENFSFLSNILQLCATQPLDAVYYSSARCGPMKVKEA